MSKYRVKLGMHVVSGLLRRNGEKFEDKSTTLAQGEGARFFESLDGAPAATTGDGATAAPAKRGPKPKGAAQAPAAGDASAAPAEGTAGAPAV